MNEAIRSMYPARHDRPARSPVGRGARGRPLPVAALAVITLSALGGCGWFVEMPFAPGTYTGDLPCTLNVMNASGMESAEVFTTPATLTVDAEGGFSVDGVKVIVGEEVVRSIPSADLAFEITSVARTGCVLTVVYEPRPTLVGISVEGELVETYIWRMGSIRLSAQAELLITDVSGASTLTADCAGTLTAQ